MQVQVKFSITIPSEVVNVLFVLSNNNPKLVSFVVFNFY